MKQRIILPMTITMCFLAHIANAKVSDVDAQKLGNTLTPNGAVMAANKDGSIPKWEGGITQPIKGYKKGQHHLDPYQNEKPLFTITSANKDKYLTILTAGQKALLNLYPTSFKMHVYKTHRSASLPQYVYDATKKNATHAELVSNGNGVAGAAIGVPFPIPQNGLEVIWNHILRFRGVDATTQRNQAAPTKGGSFTLIELSEQLRFEYSRPEMTPEKLAEKNTVFYFKQVVSQPARLAGTALLVKETLNQSVLPRQAWTYNTGQRRVRKAPNVAYDTPGTVSDGLRTTDDYDMFNGSPDRYNWELMGKEEIYIPYNDYRLHSDKLKYKDILTPGHINSDLVRWEKHRVWVVKGSLKQGNRHTYKTRVFYIDEDSWQISQADLYDNRDQLYRVAFAHGINYYEVPTHWSTLEVFHDLQSRRYLAIGLDNEGRMYDFDAKLRKSDFTPAALRRSGIR